MALDVSDAQSRNPDGAIYADALLKLFGTCEAELKRLGLVADEPKEAGYVPENWRTGV